MSTRIVALTAFVTALADAQAATANELASASEVPMVHAPGAAAPAGGEPERRGVQERRGVSAAGVGASVLPGALIHGSGHYVAGERGTAKRLLWVELTGLGLVVLAALPAPILGAHPYVVPVSALFAMTGVALFGGSWLFDVYGAAVPMDARGLPSTRPEPLVSFLGYRYVYDPLFEYRHFVTQGFELWHGAFRLSPRLDLSPDDNNARYRAVLSTRLLGATPESPRRGLADGSFLDLNAGYTHHRFPRDGFDVTTGELSASARLDVRHLDPKLLGMFFDWGVGVGLSRYGYEATGAASDANSLLLMNFGLGAYLGNPDQRGGEARLYYDHRHDDYAAGLKLRRLGSGVLGHFGADLRYYFTPEFGVHMDFQVGSAYVTEGSLLYRPRAVR